MILIVPHDDDYLMWKGYKIDLGKLFTSVPMVGKRYTCSSCKLCTVICKKSFYLLSFASTDLDISVERKNF